MARDLRSEQEKAKQTRISKLLNRKRTLEAELRSLEESLTFVDDNLQRQHEIDRRSWFTRQLDEIIRNLRALT